MIFAILLFLFFAGFVASMVYYLVVFYKKPSSDRTLLDINLAIINVFMILFGLTAVWAQVRHGEAAMSLLPWIRTRPASIVSLQ